MRPATIILLIYLGYAGGTLQVLAFKDKFEILGILLAVSIILIIIAGAMHGAKGGKKQSRTIPRRSSAKNRSAKSKMRVVSR